jgi:hypothetical protein
MDAVPCPKCKGGCDLCSGTGRVSRGASQIYNREESRRTAKMPVSQLQQYWAEEAATTPDVLTAADRRARLGMYALIVSVALALGIAIGLLLRAAAG